MKLGQVLVLAMVIFAMVAMPVSAKSDNANDEAPGQENSNPDAPGQGDDDKRPGNGGNADKENGDKNHEHTGAPGQNKD
jgi:hypothetical protein